MSTTVSTLALLKAALSNPLSVDADLMKAFTESGSPTTGLTYYDLQAGALTLYPVITPLRNRIPRVTSGRGTQANWKAITGINTGSLDIGVSQGNRGGVIATSTMDYMAAYRGLGLEDYVTYEADYAADGFADTRALSVQGLLRSLMIGEEKVILGGNTSNPLGTTPTPSLADVSVGGALPANTTYSVIAVALTPQAFMSGSVANGIQAAITRTNADWSTDTYGGGSARKSANATITTANDGSAAHKLTAYIAQVTGAIATAWYWGPAGAEVLGAITTVNSLVITAAATGTQTAASLPAADNSTNSLVFDGILTQTAKAGGYYHAMPTGTAGVGTPLTADGAGGIVEIDAALQYFWDNYRLSPTCIRVNSQEAQSITKKVLLGGSNGAQRFIINTQQGEIKGGDLVTSYLNKFGLDGARAIPIEQHPNMPAGTILFDTAELPYPLSGVNSVLQMRCRRDYYQIAWPEKSRKYEYGVYFDGVLQNYFPPAFGTITNIANG